MNDPNSPLSVHARIAELQRENVRLKKKIFHLEKNFDESITIIKWYAGDFDGKQGSRWNGDIFFYEDKFGGTSSASGSKQADQFLTKVKR